MTSKPAEFRLNTLKNFHNFSKNSWMDYGTYNQRVNTEVNRMNQDINEHPEEEEEIEDISSDDENLYQDTDFDNGLVIGGNEPIIQRAHSYPADFASTPSPNSQRSRGIAAKVGSPILKYENNNNDMKYLKTFENISWMNDIVKQDIGELSTVGDDYYTMNLKDIDIVPNGKILHVDFYEKTNRDYNGTGKFKYTPSKIESLSGDIVPIEMRGILQDVYDENEEAIIEFVYNIVDDLSL